MNDRLRGVLPFIIGLVSFALLAWFDHVRGFMLWRNYALSGFLLGIPTVWTLYHYDVRIPHYIQWVVVGAMWCHYGGGSLGSPDPYHMGLLGMHGVNGAYHHFDWWDHLTHGAGIGATAMGMAYLFEVYQLRRGLQWGGAGVWLLSLLTSMTIGVGVELYEFLGKTAFQTIDQGGYENTMRDLHFNLIGAGFAGGIAVGLNRTRFRDRIRDQWQAQTLVPLDAPWWQRTTSSMAGITAFVFVPATTALALATRFFAQEIPPDDLHLYDPALNTLTVMTAIAVVAGLVTNRMHASKLRKEAHAA